MWGRGDYAAVAGQLHFAAELLCESVDLHAGDRVLDVATGTGNAAVAAARRRCEVVGLDYVGSLLDRGRARCEAEGLGARFLEGDAEALPLPDGSFDVVLSVYGCMFAPDHERTAAEILRVCRPGGTIGLACWRPDGFVGELFALLARFAPPPPGLDPPTRWGTEERLGELFGAGIASLRTTTRTNVFRFRSVDEYVRFYCTKFGPIVTALEQLDEDGRAALATELGDHVRAHNRRDDGRVTYGAEYLEAVAVRA